MNITWNNLKIFLIFVHFLKMILDKLWNRGKYTSKDYEIIRYCAYIYIYDLHIIIIIIYCIRWEIFFIFLHFQLFMIFGNLFIKNL